MSIDSKVFNERIYSFVLMIPTGKVAAYGQLAFMAGYPRGARMAGRAMRNAPSDRNIPFYRVVNQTGDTAPGHVFGSKTHQRAMLEAEEVIFKSNGKVDMKSCQWSP